MLKYFCYNKIHCLLNNAYYSNFFILQYNNRKSIISVHLPLQQASQILALLGPTSQQHECKQSQSILLAPKILEYHRKYLFLIRIPSPLYTDQSRLFLHNPPNPEEDCPISDPYINKIVT